MTAPPPTLPQPDADAQAHSGRVAEAIRDAIRHAGGWIPLAEYLRLALYAPGLGYYVAGARKLGAEGDFVTAPEISPLFAAALAVQVEAILARSARREILELGGGSGRLAADLLIVLAARGAMPERYRIVEVSPELAARQRTTIARFAAVHSHRVEWCDSLPATDGCVLMNEVLDAVPPHVVVRRAGEWLERGVALDGRAAFVFEDRLLDDAGVQRLAEERFPPGIDYVSEVNPAAEALVETAGERIEGGALLVLDYGFARHEYYHPQRNEGTLVGHYRHRVHHDPFLWPGLSDLTAHVDFTAVAEAGMHAGLALAGFTTQEAFLLGCGILDRLRDVGEPGSLGYVKASGDVQRLVSPAEMGELFKVMMLARSEGIATPGFALADARERL